jgi:DNA-binding MarR family transcriptional regulator
MTRMTTASPPPAPALRAIRAWATLEEAFESFDRYLGKRFGVTRAQLAMLRTVGERGPVTLADLRVHLAMHPATLGQIVGRLAGRGLVRLERDVGDRRRRLVELTGEGRKLLRAAPLAGPMKLRSTRADSDRLRALGDALADAIELFGLKPWAPRPGKRGPRRAVRP